MNKNRTLVVVSIVTASLAAMIVTATPQLFNTPLYTFRMEQQSSEMHFLPTEMNTFTYATEKGFTVEQKISPWSSEVHKFQDSAIVCPTVNTCFTCSTCDSCLICHTISNCPTEGSSTCEQTECILETCMQTVCGQTCQGCG